MHAPAQEDDAAELAQTLHGAVGVFEALDMAARAARHLGHDVQASDWDARASELGEDQRSTVLLALLMGVCWVRKRYRSRPV